MRDKTGKMNRKQNEWLNYAAKRGLIVAAVCADVVDGNKLLLPMVNNPLPVEEIARRNKLPYSGIWKISPIIIDDPKKHTGNECDCGACEDCKAAFHELLHYRY